MVEHCIGVAIRIAEDYGGAEHFAQVQAFLERYRPALPVAGPGTTSNPGLDETDQRRSP